MKRSYMRKSTPKRGRKVGNYSGKVRLYGKDLTLLRLNVFTRARGLCEKCGVFVDWDSGHMHHKRHRSLGGSDSMRNCVFLCPICHGKQHNQ